jgi:carboxypeptidase C (cathepsin A)
VSSSSISKSSESKPTESSSSSSDVETVPSTTIKTKEAMAADLSKARLELYQAGFNSADISDEQLLNYWYEAIDKNLDFVEYVKSK